MSSYRAAMGPTSAKPAGASASTRRGGLSCLRYRSSHIVRDSTQECSAVFSRVSWGACFSCRMKGHFARDCPVRQRSGALDFCEEVVGCGTTSYEAEAMEEV